MPATANATTTKPAERILMLPLAKIALDRGTQSRAELRSDVVAQYADALRGTDGVAPVEMPPVVVFWVVEDGRGCYILASGFHRWHGHQQAGRKHVNARVHDGTLRDAILYSVGTNVQHGLQRTSDDKRYAVGLLVSDPEWATWSDNRIARQCCVSNHLVAAVRASLGQVPSNERIYTDRYGHTSTMDTAAIGPDAPDDDRDEDDTDLDDSDPGDLVPEDTARDLPPPGLAQHDSADQPRLEAQCLASARKFLRHTARLATLLGQGAQEVRRDTLRRAQEIEGRSRRRD